MVIGGSQVYELFLPDTERLYLTRVHAEVEGDALFPEFSSLEWRLVSDESCPADDRNAFDYSFQVYERA